MPTTAARSTTSCTMCGYPVYPVHPHRRARHRGDRRRRRPRDRGGTDRCTPRRRPLTSRSVGGEQYGRFLVDVFDEWVRRMSAPSTCRCSTSRLPTGSAQPRPVRVFGDVRACPRYRAQRRPVLLRPLRRAGSGSVISRAPAWSTWSPPNSSRRSVRLNGIHCRRTAGSAMCGLPATAGARATGSSARPMASPGSIICALGTKCSSTTSAIRWARWPRSCAAGAPGGDHGPLRGGRRPARSQRSVHVRQRRQVEALPRRPAGRMTCGQRRLPLPA